ncbi:MAG: hypothetical protein AAF304_06270 [Pseudomonadota bacterium]
MSKTLKCFALLLLVLAIHSPVFAEEYREMKRFCMWKASAAQVIAMNRDFGLNEIEVTGQYLNQETDYTEQVLVLKLIDKIYGPYEYVTHDTIYSQTNKTCLRDFYIDKTQEVFLSQHMNGNY